MFLLFPCEIGLGTHKKHFTEAFLMSTQNMFKRRNKKY